jgi:hypothetical protein
VPGSERWETACTMRNFIVACVLLVSLATQASAEDILGWQNTRWGMTVDQAAVALGNQGRRVEPPEKFKNHYAPLKTKIQISGYDLDVLLQFSDQTKTLQQVLLKSSTGGLSLWATLRDLLTEKYGAPIQIGKAREWRSKSTIIELDHLLIPGIIEQVSIRYYPASQYKDEKQKL